MSDVREHTPLPYRHKLQAGGDGVAIVDANGSAVVQVWGKTAELRRERAEFVVRACNSHDKLVTACADLVNELGSSQEAVAREYGLQARNVWSRAVGILSEIEG